MTTTPRRAIAAIATAVATAALCTGPGLLPAGADDAPTDDAASTTTSTTVEGGAVEEGTADDGTTTSSSSSSSTSTSTTLPPTTSSTGAGATSATLPKAALPRWITTIAPPRTTVPPTTRPRGPQAPAGTGTGRRIVYCGRCQQVWLVEASGAVARTYRVSGRQGVPRVGTYSVFSKSPTTRSGAVTMRYMVRFAHGRNLAIGFHTIPRDSRGRPIQSTRELGSYRSHGCVRQADADAIALWHFAPVGTKVVVV